MLAEPRETVAVEWPVENHRGTRTVQRYRVNQRGSLPIATGNRFHQSLAAVTPAAQPRQVGLDAGFVKKNQPLGVDCLLAFVPIPAPAGYVRTVLFGSSRRLFL